MCRHGVNFERARKRDVPYEPGGVQTHNKGGRSWTQAEDEELLRFVEPTERQLGKLIIKLRRPRSVVVARHAYVHARAAEEAEARRRRRQQMAEVLRRTAPQTAPH